MNFYLLILLAYSGFLILIGYRASRQVNDPESFFVASRQLGPGLLFSTLLAANIGAGSTVGATGLGYDAGLCAWWWVGSAGIGSAVLALTLAPRIWEIAKSRHLLTVGDFLEYRYDHRVRSAIASLLWVASLAILAGQFIAIAWILNVCANVPKWMGCLLGGSVTTGYFALGGLRSAVKVNLVQVIVKTCGFLMAVPVAWRAAGGSTAIFSSLTRTSADASPLPDTYLSLFGTNGTAALYYFILIAPSFLISPGILQKVFAARSRAAARQGVMLNAVVMLLFAILPAGLGIIARSRFPVLPDRELALPSVLINLLPPSIGAVTLAAVFSAELGSADAVLSMLSTSFAKDFIQRYLHPNSTAQNLTLTVRLAALGAGVLSTALAMALPSVIVSLEIFYSLLTSALFVPLIFGVYWRRPGPPAALSSILIGVIFTISSRLLTTRESLGVLSPVALGIVAAAVTLVLLSMMGSQKRSMDRI